MNIVLLDAKTLGDDVDLTGLSRFGSVAVYPNTAPEDRAARMRSADIVITNKVVMDMPAIDAAPSLKLICVAATGMNNVDLEYAEQRGIAVKNVIGYSTESVVQVTFSHVLYLLTQHAYYDTYAKTCWKDSGIFTHLGRPFFELSGKQWGVIGLGTIGRRVAETAQAFGCRAVYTSTSGRNTTQEFPRLALDELLHTSSIITIHAPLNERTRNLIDYQKLYRIPEGSVIVNAGRGGIINEADLARVLDERHIYAGTDVMSTEPIAPDSPLLNIKHQERLSITPHIAWSSTEARQRLVAGIETNIGSFLSDRPKA